MKKKENKWTNIMIGGLLVLVLILAFVFSTMRTNKGISNEELKTIENLKDVKEFNKLTLASYKELLTSGNHILYIGRATCGHCSSFSPKLQKIATYYNLTVNYLDTDTLTEKEITEFYNSNSFFQTEWGTPLLIIVKDGKFVDNTQGDTTIVNAINFLVKNSLIELKEETNE